LSFGRLIYHEFATDEKDLFIPTSFYLTFFLLPEKAFLITILSKGSWRSLIVGDFSFDEDSLTKGWKLIDLMIDNIRISSV